MQSTLPRSFDLEGNAAICRHVAVAIQPEPQIRADIANQELKRAHVDELADVHQLVREQPTVIAGAISHQNGATERDRVSLWRHRRADNDPIAISVVNTHTPRLPTPLGVALVEQAKRPSDRQLRREASRRN